MARYEDLSWATDGSLSTERVKPLIRIDTRFANDIFF